MPSQGRLEGIPGMDDMPPGMVVDQQDPELQLRSVVPPLTRDRMDFDIPEISSSTSRQSQIVNDIIRQHHVVSAAASEIYRLKTLWYATLPISRIPPEILSTIFLRYAQSVRAPITPFDDEAMYQSHRSLTKSYFWLRICLVCRHWKDVALTSPSLWAWIVPGRVDVVQRALQRSGEHPLTFSNIPLSDYDPALWYCSAAPPDTLSETIHSYWPRIEKTQLLITDKFLLENIDAPLLRSLYIVVKDELPSTVSEPFFKEHGTPNLSSLSWSAPLRWNLLQPLLKPQLQSLRVQKQGYRDPLIGVEIWLDVLQNMTSLRYLNLDKVVKSLPEPKEMAPIPMVQLPNLTVLRITTAHHTRGDVKILAGDVYLFAMLQIPIHASIEYDICCVTAESDIADIATMFSAHASGRGHQRLDIRWQRNSTIALRTEKISMISIVDDSVSIRIEQYSPTMVQFSAHVRLEGITEMRVELAGKSDKTNRMLMNIFRATPRLRSIFFTGRRVLGWLPAAILPSDTAQENVSVPGSCVLPDLAVLTLDNVDWHNPGYLETGIAEFIDALVARSTCGFCLSTLKIRRNVGITAADIDYIRCNNCVATVDWDGITVDPNTRFYNL